MTSLRVFGHTDCFGFVSNSHRRSPVSALLALTQPSPWPTMTCTVSPIVATAGEDHWPCRMRSSTGLSSQASLPVFLLMAMIDGALGEGTLTWLSSWPFEVFTKIRSPCDTGEAFDML